MEKIHPAAGSSHINIICPIQISAFLFLPSKYHITGFPKIKNPVNAAEKTKSMSIAIGIKIISSSPKSPFL